MSPEDLMRLRALTLAFYKEATSTADQDICGSFLDLVNNRREATALTLRREADRIWAYDKKEAKRLHDKARSLETKE